MFGAAEIIALGALVLSGYATWTTSKFNQKQKQLIESQERLNQLLLEKEQGEAKAGLKADLGATFLKIGSNKYRLKIWNRGKVAARNVTISFPEGNDCVPDSEISSTFPLEVLDLQHSVELIAIVGWDTRKKHPITLKWADDFSPSNEKTVYPTT